MNKIFWLTLLMLVTACQGKNDIKNAITLPACPASKSFPEFEIAIQTAEALPASAAIFVDGISARNECVKNPKADAQVEIERAQNEFKFSYKFFEETSLPSQISFEVYDLGDCTTAPVLFYKADQVPLAFAKSYPYGKRCEGVTNAKVELSK